MDLPDSSFRLVFGNAPIVKVIDFFLDHREFDYNLTQIARETDVGWSTLFTFWKTLVCFGVVVKTRKIGRAQMYKLDESNPIVQKLIEIDDVISAEMVCREKDIALLLKT